MEVSNSNKNIKNTLNKLKSNTDNRSNLILGEFLLRHQKLNKYNENIYDSFLEKLDESDISLGKKIVLYEYLSSIFNKNINLNKSFNKIEDLFKQLFMTKYNFLIKYILYKYLNNQEHKCNINKSTETFKTKCPNLKINIGKLHEMKKPLIFNETEFNNKKNLIIKLLQEYYNKKCTFIGRLSF
jgi:hypothetical protein